MPGRFPPIGMARGTVLWFDMIKETIPSEGKSVRDFGFYTDRRVKVTHAAILTQDRVR